MAKMNNEVKKILIRSAHTLKKEIYELRLHLKNIQPEFANMVAKRESILNAITQKENTVKDILDCINEKPGGINAETIRN